MGQPIEYVLDHTIEWINAVDEELSRQDMDDAVFQLQLHGADSKAVNELRKEFEKQFMSSEEREKMEKEKIRIPVNTFAESGIKLAKPTGTKVKRHG